MDSACSLVADEIRDQQASMRQKGKSSKPSEVLPSPSPSKSRPTSPTKSAMKRNSSFTPVDQPTPRKRKVVFMNLEEDNEADMANIMETPNKKRIKLTFSAPSKAALSPGASSSRVTLDMVAETEEPMEVDPSQKQPSATVTSESHFTPRRSTRLLSSPTKVSPTKRTPTPRSKSKHAHSTLVEEDGSEFPQPTRVRPVFLDHKQWFSRDPRIQREIKRGDELNQKMLETYGESLIERYRPTVAVL
jgi:hypothetical protein